VNVRELGEQFKIQKLAGRYELIRDLGRHEPRKIVAMEH